MFYLTGPIKEKLKLSIVKKNADSTIQLTWPGAKVEKEITNSLYYDAQCLTCKKPNCHYTACNNVDYNPRQYNLTKTSVEISNLQPGHRYKFRVYPKTVINNFISKNEWVFSEETYELPPLLGMYMHAVIVAHIISKIPHISNYI